MFQLVSARADARRFVCALTVGLLSAVALGASSEARAEVSALQSPTSPAPSVSDAALRFAVARTDLSPMGLLNRSVPVVAYPPAQLAASVPVRTPAAASVNGRELDCMAQAVYFEARGEPVLGQVGVAQVVLNRVRHPLFPKSVCGVVFQRAGHSCQFSWACHRPSGPGNAGQWAQARAVAARVMAGEVVASLSFATHFNGARARGFGSGLQRVTQIGQHAFYRFNGPKGSPSMFGAPVRIAQAQQAVAPRVTYASLLPLPSTADTVKLLASASAVVHQAANVAQSAVGAAAQSLVGQGAPTGQPDQARAAVSPAPVAPSASERATAQVEQTATAAG